MNNSTIATFANDSNAVKIMANVTGKGRDIISSDSTLQFNDDVSTSKTLGSQKIDFSGSGTLALVDPDGFYGGISDFSKGDTVELLDLGRFLLSHAHMA